MLSRRLRQLFAFVWLTSLIASCNNAADNPKEGLDMLIVRAKWTIEEITVNDAVTFKDGKMIQQFGGIDFERYMETVSFKKNGDFEGYFKGETKPMLLRWKLNKSDITVVAADNEKSGAWTILPAEISKKSFTMKTQSTAYDYPRMTKIALKFKAD